MLPLVNRIFQCFGLVALLGFVSCPGATTGLPPSLRSFSPLPIAFVGDKDTAKLVGRLVGLLDDAPIEEQRIFDVVPKAPTPIDAAVIWDSDFKANLDAAIQSSVQKKCSIDLKTIMS